MDPLSDVLRLTEVTAHLSAGMTGHGRWAVAFDAPVGVKFNAVSRGQCVLRVGGEVVTLGEGDCFLLSREQPFLLATDVDALPRPASQVFATTDSAGVAHVGDADGSNEVSLIGGRFDFGSRAQRLLMSQLPPVVHVAADRPEAATLRAMVATIATETRATQAGSAVVAESLALVMLVEMLRHRLEGESTGWLAGLRDPVVAAAIEAIHAQPAHAWTVGELAAVASVSRSTLAARFATVVGTGPLTYLTQWRMELAAQRLRVGDESLGVIAREVGYTSESALSVAFKRVIGSSPGVYRKAADVHPG